MRLIVTCLFFCAAKINNPHDKKLISSIFYFATQEIQLGAHGNFKVIIKAMNDTTSILDCQRSAGFWCNEAILNESAINNKRTTILYPDANKLPN